MKGILPAGLLEQIGSRSQRGGRVVKALPYGVASWWTAHCHSFVRIDRTRMDPSMVWPAGKSADGVSQVSSDPAHAGDLRSLIMSVASAASPDSQAFLVLEFWASHPQKDPDTFKIFGPLNNALEQALEKKV